MKKFFSSVLYVGIFSLSLGALSSNVQAVVVTNGLTETIADGHGGPFFEGTHFELSDDPTVGSFLGGEELRGISEFNITAFSKVRSTVLTFNVPEPVPIFGQPGLASDAFSIDIVTYRGNNSADLSDWEAPTSGFVATFNTVDINVGDILSFDVTGLLNTAIMDGDSSFGIRLQQSTRDASNLPFEFNNFQLNTVPVPGTLLLIGLALPLLVSRLRFTSQL